MTTAIYFDASSVNSIDISASLFFDTNVWLYLHGPYANPSDARTSLYSKLLGRITKAGSPIYTDTIVICEFVNRYIRIMYNDLASSESSNTDFKAFRKTQDYKDIAEAAADDVYHILSLCQISSAGLTPAEMSAVCDAAKEEDIDFNDLVVVETCRRHGYTLVTHDRDFWGQTIPILSGNRRYQT